MYTIPVGLTFYYFKKFLKPMIVQSSYCSIDEGLSTVTLTSTDVTCSPSSVGNKLFLKRSVLEKIVLFMFVQESLLL